MKQPRRKSQKILSRRAGLSFRDKVFEVVGKIPSGKTLCYGEVARRAGNRRATRAVGAILRTNFDPKIPCHRVIRADGRLGGYNRGVKLKQERLAQEKNESRGII